MGRWVGTAALILGAGVAGCPGEEHGGASAATASGRPSGSIASAASAVVAPASAASPTTGAASASSKATAAGSTPSPLDPFAPPPDGGSAVAASIGSTGVIVPKSLGAGQRGPFVLFLHGLGASGSTLAKALGVAALSDKKRFAWAAPDGPTNRRGQRFWNASKACCDFDGAATDHVAELGAVLAAARTNPSVDPKRVFVVGYSNGGFMAHRLACTTAGIAGIVSIAGAGPADADPPCKPAAPVAVLQIHGDADDVVRYGGGRALSRADLAPHPSAIDTVTGWAKRDGCGAAPAAAGTLDLEKKLEGDETTVQRFAGCRKPVELWSVQGGSHFVAQSEAALDAALSFLEKATSQ